MSNLYMTRLPNIGISKAEKLNSSVPSLFMIRDTETRLTSATLLKRAHHSIG